MLSNDKHFLSSLTNETLIYLLIENFSAGTILSAIINEQLLQHGCELTINLFQMQRLDRSIFHLFNFQYIAH